MRGSKSQDSWPRKHPLDASDCVAVESQRVMLTFPLDKQNEKGVDALKVDK